MDAGSYRPRAREDGLLTEPLGEELLVCDIDSDAAHLLNETAATVWRACGGNRDIAALQVHCGLDEDTVRLALERLSDCGLLEDPDVPSGVSRRTMLRRGVIAGAGIGAGLPVIRSIIVPTPAMAASGTTTAGPTTTAVPNTTPGGGGPGTTAGPTTTAGGTTTAAPTTTPAPTTTASPTTTQILFSRR
jgi:hypothetical protein